MEPDEIAPIVERLAAWANDPAVIAMVATGSIALLTVLVVVFFARARIRRSERALLVRDTQLQAAEDGRQSLTTTIEQLQIELRRSEQATNELATQHARSEQQQESTAAQLVEARQELVQTRTQMNALREDTTQLRTAMAAAEAERNERDLGHEKQVQQFAEQKASLTKEFQNLANQIFDEKGRQFSTSSQVSLDALLKPFKEQISSFQHRVNQIHTDSVKGNAQLEAEIKKVRDIGLKMQADATNLTAALKGDSQQRGAWGEAQLERTLQMSGLVEGDHYGGQESFKDAEGKTKRTDYVIKLPDGRHLIIDSKVNLPDYDRAIAAEKNEDVAIALKAHVGAVRKHIDDLSAKDYTQVIGINSPSFVLMFMPIEPAYIEALKYDKELFNYGYQKNVVLVSHTTLIPILRTVANLWMLEQSNREARMLGDKAMEIYNQVCLVSQRVERLGKTLSTSGSQYNDVVKALVGQQGLRGKIERFGQLSSKTKKSMPALEEVDVNVQNEGLLFTAKPIDEEVLIEKGGDVEAAELHAETLDES